MIQLREHRDPLLLVERIGKLCHLAPDETLLPAALALARAAETIERDQIGAEHVHGAGDSADFVLAVGALDTGSRSPRDSAFSTPTPSVNGANERAM